MSTNELLLTRVQTNLHHQRGISGPNRRCLSNETSLAARNKKRKLYLQASAIYELFVIGSFP